VRNDEISGRERGSRKERHERENMRKGGGSHRERNLVKEDGQQTAPEGKPKGPSGAGRSYLGGERNIRE